MKPNVAVVLVLVAVVGAGCKKEQSNVARGKELLLIDEVKSAQTEFKIATKQDPDNKTAKAMLLYADARASNDVVALFEAVPVLRGLADPKVRDAADPAQLEIITKGAASARQHAYEGGVDTKDGVEFADVIEEAARYVFESGKRDAEVETAAYVLGLGGDSKAVKRLCEGLKKKEAEGLVRYLISIGDASVGCLEEVIANPESLGRENALGALEAIRARSVAFNLFKENPSVRGFDQLQANFPVTGGRSEQTERSMFATLTRARPLNGYVFRNENPKLTLRALTAPRKKDSIDGELVLFEAFDPDKQTSVVQFFTFERGKLTRAPVMLNGKAVELSSDGPTLRFRATPAGQVELVRGLVREAEETVKSTPQPTPAKGTRVFIDRVNALATVTAIDEFGLIHVTFDSPQNGHADGQVPPGLVFDTKTVKAKKSMVQITTMNLSAKGDFTLENPGVIAPAAWPESSEHFGAPE